MITLSDIIAIANRKPDHSTTLKEIIDTMSVEGK